MFGQGISKHCSLLISLINIDVSFLTFESRSSCARTFRNERSRLSRSAVAAVQERERTQDHAKAIKSNSCYETDRRIKHIADREGGDDTHYERHQYAKTNRKEVDNVACFSVHSEEGQLERRLWYFHGFLLAGECVGEETCLAPSPTTDVGPSWLIQ